MIEDLEKKLDNIDKILGSKEAFSQYINDIEKEDVKITINIQKSVKDAISRERKKIRKNKYYDILKIASCTILALTLWQITLPSVTSYASIENIRKEEDMVYNKLDSTMEKISEFFNSPIKLERGDK